jgi:hypothetical protein
VEETVPVPMIISDYAEKADDMLNPFEGKKTDEFDDMIKVLYDMYISIALSPQDAIENIASVEPYIYSPEKIALFCQKEGINLE